MSFRVSTDHLDLTYEDLTYEDLTHEDLTHEDLTYEAMELPSDPGLTMLAYTAVKLLASWAATEVTDELSAALPVAGEGPNCTRFPGPGRP